MQTCPFLSGCCVAAGFSLPWLLLVLTLPLAVLLTSLLTAIIVWWCAMRRRQPGQLRQSPRHISSPLQAFDSERQSVRQSDHIYTLPNSFRNSDGSMMYNMAYQSSFKMQSNAAYLSSSVQSSTELSQ